MDGETNERGQALIIRVLQDGPHGFWGHLSGIMEDWKQVDNSEEMGRGFAERCGQE